MVRGAGVLLALLLYSQVLSGADGKTQAAGSGGLDEVAAVLSAAHNDLKTRLEETLDRRIRSLIKSPEGFTQELRRMLFRARDAAHLDLLIAVSKKGAEPARFILSSDGLSVRARVEEDPAARALVEAIALGGHPASPEHGGESDGEHRAGSELLRGVPFVALPESFFEEIVSGPGQEADSSQPDLFMIHVASAGNEVALVGGIRLSTLAAGIQKGLDKRWGPKGPRWSAFLAGKPSKAKDPFAIGPGSRIVAGEGQGLAVPEELISLLAREGRVVWQDGGKDRSASAGAPGTLQGEWLVLRDRNGSATGGIGVRVPISSFASASQADEMAREARRLAEWATAAVIGGLTTLAAWLLLTPRRKRSSRSGRRRKGALSQAREELSTELKTAAQKLSDPMLLGPILERAVEHAVARAGGTLACEIGQRIASTIAQFAPRESVSRQAPPPEGQGGESRGDGIARTVLGQSFPIPMLAVDDRLNVIAWNPAAERLWGAEADERLGKNLDRLDFFGIEGEMRGRAHRVIETCVVEPPVRLSFDRDRIHHIQLTVLPLHARDPGAAEGDGPAAGDDAPGPQPTGALLIAENVSEKIEHEIAAKILGQYQKALSASLPLPMVVVDAEGRVMSWNAAAENLFGVPERDALGKDFTSIQQPAVEQTTLPFCTPDGTQRGVMYLYGKGAQALDVPLEDTPKAEPVAKTAG